MAKSTKDPNKGRFLADPNFEDYQKSIDYSQYIKQNTPSSYSEGVPEQSSYTTGPSVDYENYTRSPYDKGQVTTEDLPSLEDTRATNQGTFTALGDATAKFLGKTVLSTVGNLAGTIYGVGDAVANGQFSKIWDNSFMDAVDAGNKKLDNIFQVYKNSDFQQQNILQKLFLHPTQFTDEATDTASFMAGAILSEIATSGLASETIVPRALKYMKYLSEGAEAAEATSALTSLATKGIVLAGDLGTSIKHLAMGASYEGIVEARQATMELRQKMEEDYSKDHPGEDIPQSVRDDIDDRLSKAGVMTYLSNVALVGSTNLLLFPKLFGLGHSTSKIAAGAIERDAETGLFKAAKEGHSLLDNIGTGLTKPLEESTKFGVQGAVSKTNIEFFDRKHDEDAKEKTSNYLETFASKLGEEYTTKEGWNNIGMGMIIGALGAPGRGILSALGKDHPLGKYGYKDVTDGDGNSLGKEKLPLWQGGIAGSFQERAQEEAKIGKVLNDLNENTNFFKAAQANYNTLVENNSLQKDQDAALRNNDIFNFQNAKDDQIHSYVSSRVKNNLYDDLLDEVDKMKKLSPDEFYTNFKGEEAANKANNREKTIFQSNTISQFLEKAQNTRDAIKISDDVYRGDNEDLRDHLTHSIAASKNLDLRERLINQSIADLSDGMLSNLNLRTSKESVGDIMDKLKEINPTAYALNKDKIQTLLQDSEKLRDKRQDYLDVYNKLFTQEGQKQFEDTQKKYYETIQKAQEVEAKKKEEKVQEDIKKENIKETVKKAKDLNPTEKEAIAQEEDLHNLPEDVKTGKNLSKKSATNVNLDDTEDNLPTEGTKEAPQETISTESTTNTPKENNVLEASNTGLETIPKDDALDPEETAVVNIEGSKELATQREVATTDTGLALNDKVERYQDNTNAIKLINEDYLRTIGNVGAYLGIDKITTGKFNKEDNTVTLRTYDIFDDNGNVEINKFVEPKLFSQNHYTVNTPIELFVPTFDEMEERGLQEYNNSEYNTKIDSLEEFPIAIRGQDGKIVMYLPTQSSIKSRVAPEFREQALKENLALREVINENRENTYKGTIVSKSPGFIIADKYEVQKSLFNALGDSKKLADKVKLGIVKVEKDITGANREATPNDLRIDMSNTPFKEGEIVNSKSLSNGVVYAILPSSAKEKYIVYPMKVNTIGVNNAKTITEAIKLFAKQDNLSIEEKKSLDNIGDFNIKDFKDLTEFVNKIMYASSGVNAGDKTIFKLFKNKLILSSLEDDIFPLEDIISSQAIRDKIVDILADRYHSVGLKDLNSSEPYVSYHLNKDTGSIEEKQNDSYQHYINDNKVLTTNVRGVHIEGNEYAFTAQPVIGISNTISRDVKEISNKKEEDKDSIEDAQVIEDTPVEKKEPQTKPEEEPTVRKTKKTTIDPSKIKRAPLNDISPEYIKKVNQNEIDKAPKILKTLELPKVEALFKNQFLKGNKDKFYNEVISLGGGKEQTQILKNWIEQNNPESIDDLKIGIASELAYTTEINTTRKVDYRDKNGWDELADTMDEEDVARIRGTEPRNSSYYSNLTVPGGTNYTENEIATPQVEPSIKGHAQFSTKNGIGWFRSDDKTLKESKEIPYSEAADAFDNVGKKEDTYSFTKARRILEVQSDLFQKGRDRDILVSYNDKAYETYLRYKDGILSKEDLLHQVNNGTLTQDEYNRILEGAKLNLTDIGKSRNQFLQLLNKDNNWVSFFIKSIIQDSVKKGYEEVHFPTGDTAAKVEGHSTLEGHKAHLEEEIRLSQEYLDEFSKIDRSKIVEKDQIGTFFHYEGNDRIYGNDPKSLEENLDKQIKFNQDQKDEYTRQLNELNTEGFAKLKPIWNFYENQVSAILKKNYQVEQSTDEHGNTWNTVKLDSSHSNRIYYDLSPSPNKSVIDQLFIDINKFSDSQQREIVDSIIYAIEEGKKEGYSTVEDLFDYAKDVFANNKDLYESLNEDKSFDLQIQTFNDIDSNWSKFREKSLDKLKGLGYKVTKVFEEDTTKVPNSEADDADITSEDLESPESNFVGSEATYRKNEYLDNDSSSSKDTASAHLKLKLSLIPEVEMNPNGELEPTVNYLSMSKFMDLNKVWTSLQGVLTGLPVDQIYPTITELAKSNPMYSTILNNLTSDPDTSIQNQFIVAFSKQQSKPLTAKIGYVDKFGNRTINVFGTNRQGANDILIDKWYDKFKTSPIIKDDGNGNLVVDTIEAQKALKAFNKFLENYNPKDLNISKNLQNGLSSIGINISLVTLDNLIKYGTKVGSIQYSAESFIKTYISKIFKRIAGNFDETNKIDKTGQLRIGEENSKDEETSKLSLNNPFISETKTLDILAKLENITNPFLYESSYVGGDGKPRYSITNNNYLSKFFNTLKDEERGIQRVKDILSTTYASSSVWGRKFISDAKFREDFTFHPLDSLGTNESKVTNKTFGKMSTKEKEYTRMSLFQNVGRSTSIFMSPIPSDKTTLPLIQTQKTKVIIDPSSLRIKNSEAINALYTPFTAEYNRIRETQAQNINSDKNSLIEGYHNGGMGEKFLVYDFLNNNKQLFDNTGKLKIIDSETLRNIVTPEIEKFATDLIKKQIKYWNKLGLDNNKSFDKSYKRKLGDFGEREIHSDIISSRADKAKALEISTKAALRSFAADYAINQFLAHFNYTQLISGDPALHGKATIDKTWINYSKRLAKDIAPGLDGNFTNPKFTTIFLKDLKYESKHLNEYQEVLGEKASAYKGLNPADAQEYTTLKEHLAVMDAYGRLTPLLKAAGERLMAGGDDSFDIDLILQPEKPVYVGTQVDNIMGINRMYYIKTSAFPLIPSLTKGLEIDKLRVAMENSSIDRAVYESGVKLGLGINSVSTEKSQGILNDSIDLKDKGITLDRDGFRIQQEVPFHGNSEKFVNEGSQGRKLIFSDVDDYSSINTLGTTLTGRGAKQVYEALHVEKMNRAFDKLLKDIGVDQNNKIKDLSKLQKILIDEATSRNYNINDVYGLQIEKDSNGIQRFTIPLGFNNSSSRLESIMNSLFTNRVIKSELPGFSKVQGSSAGFSKLSTIDQLNSQIKDSIVWLDPKDTTLNYIRKNSDGSKLLQADILVPSWFTDNTGKDIDLTKFVREDGTLDTDKLPEDLLTTIGLRIPTQGLNSMMSFKVKGFLPRIVGDLAIVPSEIVAQMGSDFDVDKLYMYRYHHNYDEATNSFSKIQPPQILSETKVDENGNLSNDLSKNEFNKYTDEELDNSIIQMFQDRYEDPSLLGRILEPNGFGDLPQLAEEISYLLDKDKGNHFFTTEEQNTIHKNNNDGKAGTGIFSLFSTFIKAAQDAQLRLADPVIFLMPNGTLVREDRLYGMGNTGKAPSTIISYFQSASVDNAKEQILGLLNINSNTIDVAGTIALAGYDENYIAYFLSQPILRDYVAALENSNDITNPEYNVNKELDAQRKIEDKYKLESTDDQAKFFSNIKGDLGADGIYLSLDSMREELKTPTALNQRLILNSYLKLKESAKAIRLVQNAISTDTGGLGIRYVDLQIRRNNVDLAQTNPLISNVNRLFTANTQIGKATEVLKRALNIYKEILPYETPGYKYATSNILEYSGKADKATLFAKDLTDTYNSIKSYLYSTKSLLDIDNVNIERNKLLYGTQALGNRWEAYTNTPAGKKNLLSERIQIRRTTKLSDPIRLQALNTPAANSSDNNDAMAAYYNMYHKGTEEEKALAKDLVNYFILTGAKQGANSIAKYIPYDILEAHDFSNKLHNIDSELRKDNGNNILSNVVEQYFQHNPSKAPIFSPKDHDISDYKVEGFKMKSDSKYLIPTQERNLVNPPYLSVYSNEHKNFLLYKIAKSTVLGSEYTRIDLLGDSNISEYNANAVDGQYSIIKSNSSGIAIPSNVTRVEQENKVDDTIFEKEEPSKATAIPIDKNYLTKKFNLDNTNPESTLNSIIEGSNKEYSNIATDLKRLLVNYPNLTIDNSLSESGVSGRFVDSKISINLDNILSTNKDATTATSRVILHEMLHAITANKINNYDNLSSEDKKLVDKIRVLFNQYRSNNRTKDFFRFEKVLADYKKNPEGVSDEDIQFLKDKKGEYYGLTDLNEFVAAGLTDDNFVDNLKANNFWKKLWTVVSRLLGLNESYANDYEALYSNSIRVGESKDTSTDNSANIIDDANPNTKPIQMQPDNINKIMSGEKTATSRTFKVEDGTYRMPNGVDINLKGSYYSNISQMKDPEAWAKAEGFKSLEDMRNNAKYSHTKDFINGKRGLYIYQISKNSGLSDMSPRDNKTEFLSKYHLWDGKEISLNNFNKIQSSLKANDKYKNISIDLAWENGKRVLRVFTKGGTPIWDISPKPVVPKTKEEKIVDKTLKYYSDIINKLKSKADYSTNPDLQSRVEILQSKAKEIRAENTVSIITSHAKDNLANIENTLNKDKVSTYDVQESKTFLAFYKNIRKIITYNEAFEEENKNLDLIARKAGELEKILKEKELDLIKSWTKANLNLKTNLNDVFNTPVKEVGRFESKWESGAFSTDKGIQFIQNVISKTEQKSYDSFHEYGARIRPLIKEYLQKHKDYKELLQYNKNGEWTGGLINKYSQGYYDELTARKGKAKEFAKFYRENTEQRVTEEGKKQFEQDADLLREELPEYNKEGTHDYAKFTQWYSSHNPDLYLAKVKKGRFISHEERAKYKNYISQTPIDKWLDPKYKTLKGLGEDSVEMKLYRELDSQFRTMNKAYDNNANYIPELKKDFSEKILDGQWKGAFNLLKTELQDAVSVKLDPTTNFNTLDSDGVPNKTTPVYMMSNILNPKDKSDDLGKVLMMAKLQDILLNHKSEVEPYLESARDLLIDRPAYVLNRSGNIVNNDITGEPEEDTSVGRASNASGQINFIIDKFLYDKEKEQSGVSKTASINRFTVNNKGEEHTESRAVAASKVIDTFSKYTRLKALGYNPVSSIGRILWGTLSNTIYAGDRKSYNEKANIRALKSILEWAIPGTAMNKKINHLAEYFNMRKELNEIKFGKLRIPTPKNPLANFGPYALVDKGENFIQYHTGVSVLMTQKIVDLEGKQQSIWDAFDKDGKWREDKFGPNPYENDKSRLDLSTLVQNTITAVHGDYSDAIQANDEVISRQLLVMRRWLPRSIAVRFGREYTDINTGDKVKGRYRSYELSHLNPLNLIKDFYKAFTIDPSDDNLDARNLRMNAYELAFIPVLWGMTLAMRGMLKGLYHDDDKEKAALTFLLNSSTRVSGDLTFFFNPYSFQAVMREPIPAFKTVMDFYDLGPVVLQTVEGKGTYKTGIHKGASKIAVKLAKAVPIINQPEKAYSAIKQEIEK